MPRPRATSTGTRRPTPRSCAPTSTRPVPEKGLCPEESRAAQGLGRSRGGLMSKIHTIADGRGRSLSIHVTPGQTADTKRLEALLEGIAVPRPGGAAGRGSVRTR
ncbi:transposase [Saccharothrix sp. NRRL B-16348]|uniref:transposase n=1 Tax=Saccharothrix sp. NRRL B-16348 TaxID=1415542 RepID=UPI003FA6FF6F